MWPAALSLVVATTSCAAVGAVAVLRDPARGNMLAALVAAVCLGASMLPLVGLALMPLLGLSPQLIEAYSARPLGATDRRCLQEALRRLGENQAEWLPQPTAGVVAADIA